MARQRRDTAESMDSRVYFLMHGKKAPEIPEENIASDFLFRGSRKQQMALWRQVGRDLLKQTRRPWALEKYGPPDAETAP